MARQWGAQARPQQAAHGEQRSPYDVLINQSRKLGHVATQTFGNVGRFLHQQVVVPPRDELMTGLPKASQDDLSVRTHEDISRLKQSVSKSHEVICDVQTVFPITLFPDRIVMDRTKVNIIKRSFFWSSEVISIQIEDVLNVTSSVGPFFGSLTIASRVMSTVDHFTVTNFWRRDAMELKRMIQGHVIAKQNKLDTSNIPIEELIETLRELGSDTGSPKKDTP